MSAQPVPRIVIAGAHSGVGKTSIALALVAALRRRGLAVQTFKVGPDFLDPTYLAAASGRPCYNLDGWMMGRTHVEKLVARVSRGCDLTVIEGAMGLFDGAASDRLEGSTAEIAAWLRAPVLLVANVHGMARSLAALVKGFSDFDPDVRIAGVIANHCGSETHGRLLEEALQSAALPELAGSIPRGALPKLSSRHLGLVTADPNRFSAQDLEEMAEAAEKHLSLDRVFSLARQAQPLDAAFPEIERRPERIRLGIAWDDAFHFYYRDFLDALEGAGCRLVRFSPIADREIPEGIDGLYFGGGYPEELAQALSANESMRTSVLQYGLSGGLIYAECGGLMYLCRDIEDRQGAAHPMVGLIPAGAKMRERLQALAYVEVSLKEDSLWGRRGDIAQGHEFHYSHLTGNPVGLDGWQSVYSIQKRRGGDPLDEGFQRGRILAGYAHLHLASRPECLEYFISQCEVGK